MELASWRNQFSNLVPGVCGPHRPVHKKAGATPVGYVEGGEGMCFDVGIHLVDAHFILRTLYCYWLGTIQLLVGGDF